MLTVAFLPHVLLKLNQEIFSFFETQVRIKNKTSIVNISSSHLLGNLVPQFDEAKRNESVSAENAALELACYHNDVRTGVVCGHSDCKVSIYNT